MKPLHMLAALAGATCLAGVLLLRSGGTPAEDTAAPSATVSVISLSQQSVPTYLNATGSVVAGTAEQNITLAAPGIVTSFTVRPGEAVQAGQILAHVAPDPQSAADWRKAENAVTAATAAHDHVAALLAQHLATSADLATATQALNDAQAAQSALRATGTGQARDITAPYAGTITAIAAAPGGTLPAGTVLLKLAAGNGLSALTSLPEQQALRVQPGDAASLVLLNSGATIPAIVAQRAAMLDPQTGLINITLVPQGAVLLGEPVSARIAIGNVTGYPVPRDAVLNDEQGDYIYQIDTKNIAHRVNVRVLSAEGDSDVLAPGLDSTMRVATTGAYQLADGMNATI